MIQGGCIERLMNKYLSREYKNIVIWGLYQSLYESSSKVPCPSCDSDTNHLGKRILLRKVWKRKNERYAIPG
jgi:hypothetical protein